jgi:ribosome-binding ATPase YchF (GTP1/OBG family)
VAGLVKGASTGEGLGNKFLATIRQCDAIVHVVRCFEDENVIHVDGTVDAVRDAELINLELAFADLASVEKRLERVIKRTVKQIPRKGSHWKKLMEVLYKDEPARNAVLDEEEELAIKSLGLLTRKKMIYAANVADVDLATGNAMVDKLKKVAEKEGAEVVIAFAQVEAELVELDEKDKLEFLDSLGVSLENCGLRALVRESL